jgi:hypothetical protein
VVTEKERKGIFIEKFYGDGRFSSVLMRAIGKIAESKHLKVNEKSFTNSGYRGAYSDLGVISGSGRIFYGYTPDEQIEVEKQFTLRERLINGLNRLVNKKEIGLSSNSI